MSNGTKVGEPRQTWEPADNEGAGGRAEHAQCQLWCGAVYVHCGTRPFRRLGEEALVSIGDRGLESSSSSFVHDGGRMKPLLLDPRTPGLPGSLGIKSLRLLELRVSEGQREEGSEER